MQNIDLSKIKSVIFDFDSTLYTGADWSRHQDYMYEMLVDIGGFSSAKEAEDKLIQIYPNEDDFTQRIAFYINDNRNLYKAFMQRREDKIYDTSSDNLKWVDGKLLSRLAKKYKLYIVSDSPKSYLHFYLKKYGMDENDFEMIIANRYIGEDITKYPLLKEAVDDSGCSKEEVLMVGDSLKYDKGPAEKFGLQFYLTTGVEDTESIIHALIDAKK